MSDARMSHTQEQRINYWKERMLSKVKTSYSWCFPKLNELSKDASHAGINSSIINKIIQDFERGFIELQKEIINAKPIEEKEGGENDDR